MPNGSDNHRTTNGAVSDLETRGPSIPIPGKPNKAVSSSGKIPIPGSTAVPLPSIGAGLVPLALEGATQKLRRTARIKPSQSMDTVRQIVPDGLDMWTGKLGMSSVTRASGRDPSVLRAIRIVRDYDADASKSVSDFQRLANPGHSVSCKNMDGTENPEGEKRIRLLATRLWQQGGGGADALVDVLHMSAYSYGGMGVELIPTKDFMNVKDVYPFGPMDIEFKWVPDYDDPMGEDMRMGIFPARSLPGVSEQDEVNPLQVMYLPIDPDLDDPYGRSYMLPAVVNLIQLQSLLNDIANTMKVNSQGRLDVSIDLQAVMDSAPDYLLLPENAGQLETYVAAEKNKIVDYLRKLSPWDIFIHFNSVTANTTSPIGQSSGVDTLMNELSRRVVVALKSAPFLLGSEETIQSMATVQWQVYVKGIKALHMKTKRVLEWIYNTALRLWGIPGYTVVEFNDIRETDRAMDAQAEATENQNAFNLYQWGVYDFDELAEKTAGHPPKGPAPPTAGQVLQAQTVASQLGTALKGFGNMGPQQNANNPFGPTIPIPQLPGGNGGVPDIPIPGVGSNMGGTGIGNGGSSTGSGQGITPEEMAALNAVGRDLHHIVTVAGEDVQLRMDLLRTYLEEYLGDSRGAYATAR